MEYYKDADVPCETAIPANDERTIFTLVGEATEHLGGIETMLQRMQNNLVGIEEGEVEKRGINCFRDVCAQNLDRVDHIEELLKTIMGRLGM